MILGLPSSSIDLVLLGGVLASIGHAALRRDPAWVIALGLPLLLSARAAGLPDPLIAWGCALYAAGLAIALVVVVARAIRVPSALALLGTAAAAMLVSGTADARHLALTRPSLHRPPAVGVQLADWLATLADD